jgi:hypothetical protein
MSPLPITFSAAVEGPTDEVVLRRVVEHCGAALGTVYGRTGKPALLRQLSGYNYAAQFQPWIVLVDLDQDADCAPPVCARWLRDPAPTMLFRVVVREVESWLLADRETMARFLGIGLTRVPVQVETLPNPKTTLVNLARASRRRDIRADMVPREGSGREVGPAYSARLMEYAQRFWRPDIATHKADSLRRLLTRLAELIENTRS